MFDPFATIGGISPYQGDPRKRFQQGTSSQGLASHSFTTLPYIRTETFQIGDRVFFKTNPLIPGTIVEIEPDQIRVSWDNRYVSLKDNWYNYDNLTQLSESENKSIPTSPKKIKLDKKILDKLVIDKEKKEEIIAVLKQFENAHTLFTEWGLDETIEYGKGMTFLFYGEPGTGKTWAANCMSKATGQELLVMSAAEIQTQEPGGANRNIQNAFASAKRDNKILFLDECDSLITVRSNVGIILGSEINTLLTEIEKFEGIVILTTNRVETLDPALERRISLIVEFPNPNFEQRQAIWENLLPKKMPLGEGVELSKLAEYNLTGGQIKNAVLQAARLAVVSEDKNKKVELIHFEGAINRIMASKSLMGTSSRYKQIRVKEDFTNNG